MIVHITFTSSLWIGVGKLFPAQGHWDTYNIICRPYRIISLQTSLLLMDRISNPGCSCLDSTRPSDVTHALESPQPGCFPTLQANASEQFSQHFLTTRYLLAVCHDGSGEGKSECGRMVHTTGGPHRLCYHTWPILIKLHISWRRCSTVLFLLD